MWYIITTTDNKVYYSRGVNFSPIKDSNVAFYKVFDDLGCLKKEADEKTKKNHTYLIPETQILSVKMMFSDSCKFIS